MPFVYAATMAGAHIGLWRCERGGNAWTPFWGSSSERDWAEYKDIGEDEAGQQLEGLMKYFPPLLILVRLPAAIFHLINLLPHLYRHNPIYITIPVQEHSFQAATPCPSPINRVIPLPKTPTAAPLRQHRSQVDALYPTQSSQHIKPIPICRSDWRIKLLYRSKPTIRQQ